MSDDAAIDWEDMPEEAKLAALHLTFMGEGVKGAPEGDLYGVWDGDHWQVAFSGFALWRVLSAARKAAKKYRKDISKIHIVKFRLVPVELVPIEREAKRSKKKTKP